MLGLKSPLPFSGAQRKGTHDPASIITEEGFTISRLKKIKKNQSPILYFRCGSGLIAN